MTRVVLPVWQSQKAESRETARLSGSVILVGGEFRLFPTSQKGRKKILSSLLAQGGNAAIESGGRLFPINYLRSL